MPGRVRSTYGSRCSVHVPGSTFRPLSGERLPEVPPTTDTVPDGRGHDPVPVLPFHPGPRHDEDPDAGPRRCS